MFIGMVEVVEDWNALYRAGHQAVDRGSFEQARQLYARAWEAADEEHKLWVRHALALSYEKEGLIERAVETFRETCREIEERHGLWQHAMVTPLEGIARVLGPEHAIPELERALAVRQRAVGRKHWLTAASRHALAEAYWLVGNTGAAKEQIRLALEITGFGGGLFGETGQRAILLAALSVLEPERSQEWLSQAREAWPAHCLARPEQEAFLRWPTGLGKELIFAFADFDQSPTGALLRDYDLVQCDLDLGLAPLDGLLRRGTSICRLKLSPEGITDLPDLGALDGLRHLELRGQPLNLEALRSLTELQSLVLEGPWTELPDWLGELSELVHLEVTGSHLTTIPSSVGDLRRLRRLRLPKNQLTGLPNSVSQLADLEELDLSQNDLRSLPLELGRLDHLRVLRLDGSSALGKLPDGFPGLVELSAVDTSLSALPPGPWPHLRSLKIAGGNLAELPPSLAECGLLEVLECRNCPIRALPEGNWPRLRLLDVAHTMVERLPEALYSSLKELRANHARLQSLPAGIFGPHLSVCQVEGNSLKEFPATLSTAVGLRELSASSNQLSALPPGMGGLERLAKLILRENNFTEMPPAVARLGALTNLDLCANKMERMDFGLAPACRNLECLLATDNLLTELSGALSDLIALRRLELANNRLEKWPQALESLPRLEYLRLSNNLLASLPKHPTAEVYGEGNPLRGLPQGGPQEVEAVANELAQFLQQPERATHPALRRFWDVHGPCLGKEGLMLGLLLEPEVSLAGAAMRSVVDKGSLPCRFRPIPRRSSRPALLKTLGCHPGATLFEVFGDGRILTVAPTVEAWLWAPSGERLSTWAIGAGSRLPSTGGCIMSSHPVLLSCFGTQVALINGDASWFVWDIDQDTVPRKLEPGIHSDQITLLSGRRALAVEREGLALLDLSLGKVRRLPGLRPGHPWIQHSGGCLIGCHANKVLVIHLDSGQTSELELRPTALLERSDGTLLVGTAEGTVEIWRLEGQTLSHSRSFADSPGGHVIELGPSGRSYYEEGAAHDSPVAALAEQGEVVWSASTYHFGTLKRWDTSSGACLETIPLGLDSVNKLCVMAEDRLVATSRGPSIQRVFGLERRLLGTPDLLPEKARVDAGRQVAVTLDKQGWLRHWDLLDESEKQPYEPEQGRPVAFSDSGEYLLTQHGLMWTATRLVLFSPRGNDAMSGDGKTLLGVDHKGRVSVWLADSALAWREKDPENADFTWQIGTDGSKLSSEKPQPSFDCFGRLWARHSQGGPAGDRFPSSPSAVTPGRVLIRPGALRTDGKDDVQRGYPSQPPPLGLESKKRHFLRCHEPRTGQVIAEIESSGPEQYAKGLVYHQTLPLALSAGGSKAIGVWSLDQLSVRALELDTTVKSAALHPHQPVAALVVGEFNGPTMLRLLNLQTEQVIAEWNLPTAQAPQVRFLDSEHIACVGVGPELLEFRKGLSSPQVLWRAETDLVALTVSPRGDLAVFGWGCLEILAARSSHR